MVNLVVGSKGHNRAKCVDWLQPFPNIEEYDNLIIDMTSLDQSILDKFVGRSPNPIREMPPQIQTLVSTSRHVYCLFLPELRASPIKDKATSAIAYPGESSWDWMPIQVKVVMKSGTSVEHLVEPDLSPYFECVEKWSYELAVPDAGPLLPEALEAYRGAFEEMFLPKVKKVNWSLRPVAVNKSGNNIAVKLLLPKQKTGGIYLLPPPTKCSPHDAIEVLLDIIGGSSKEGKPEWWGGVEIPKVKEIESEIDARMKVIGETRKEIEELVQRKTDAESYRNLLSETDDPLVQVVGRALRDLGIPTEPTLKGFPADLLDKGRIAIEVTGIVDKLTADTPKVGQLMRFKEKFYAGEKLVLIVNTHRRTDPAERAKLADFSDDVQVLFPPLRVCALTTLTLYKLWYDVMTGKRKASEVIEMIMSTVGVLSS